MFKDACVEAGVHGKSAHGLRKIGATRAANNGATVSELEALFGWSGGGMASLYTRNADRARLGQRAASKLVKNDTGTSMHTPDEKVRAAIRIHRIKQ
jgi:integrase